MALYISDEADQAEDATTAMQKVGFEYGDCLQERVEEPITWLWIEYTQIQGVQKVSFGNSLRSWEFGYEIFGQANITKRFEFDETNVWIGLHGIESADGIERLGIITMDSTCQPLNGQLQPEPEGETTPTDEGENENGAAGEGEIIADKDDEKGEGDVTESQEEEEGNSSKLVAVGVSAVGVVVLIAVICILVYILKKNCQKKNHQNESHDLEAPA